LSDWRSSKCSRSKARTQNAASRCRGTREPLIRRGQLAELLKTDLRVFFQGLPSLGEVVPPISPTLYRNSNCGKIKAGNY